MKGLRSCLSRPARREKARKEPDPRVTPLPQPHEIREAAGAGLLARWALATAALTIPQVLPGFGPLAYLIVPGILASIAAGLTMGQASGIIAGAFCAAMGIPLLLGMEASFLWPMQAAGLGLLFCGAVENGWSGAGTLLAGLIFLGLSFCVILAFGSPAGLSGGYGQIVEALSKELDASLALYRENMASQLAGVDIDQWSEQIRNTLIRFLPGMLALMFLFVSMSNILVVRGITRRRRLADAFRPAFAEWKLHDGLVWLVIAAGGAALALPEPFGIWGENALLVLGALYFLQGLSIITFYFAHLNVPVPVRWLIYILLGIQWYGLLGVVILGLSDVWLDLRTRASKK